MVENLTKLYNTLALIETKGENTKIMARCLQFIEQMISDSSKVEKSVKAVDEEPNG